MNALCYSRGKAKADTGSTAGGLVLNIMAPVSQWEREAIGERTRDALQHKRANVRNGSRLADDGVDVEDDPYERAALAEIRRLRDSGTTLRGIARELNHRSLRTRRGTAWRQESVARAVKQNGISVKAA